MKITLSDTQLLGPQQIGELASQLDTLHSRLLKAIERLNKSVAARKTEIASRWKSAPGIGSASWRVLRRARPSLPSARSVTTPRPSWTHCSGRPARRTRS